MTRTSIQLFAFGWFAAACCLAAVYFLAPLQESPSDSPEQTTQEKQNGETNAMDEEQLAATLESSGYIVLTEQEYTALEEENAAEPENGNSDKIKTILHIEQGMTSGDVASLLQQLEMIDDGSAFQNRLQESGRASSIQPGRYELNSTMSDRSIIKHITS
ncbi:hypothetical protein [Salibacterium sp. K-3]